MRENMGLFRGKRIDNGEWVEGAFLNDRDGAFYVCPAVSDISYGDNGNRRRIGCWYKVYPDTVGECTGLKDKNGKLIFEGDVCKVDYGGLSSLGVVTFGEGTFDSGIYRYLGWYLADEDGRRDHCSLQECADEYEGIEVIGNIHDNGGLLKEGADK